jgi:hypothetical protein
MRRGLTENNLTIGFSTKTHSDFARHLLLNFGEDEPLQLVINGISRRW